ncbi:MAG: inosine/xanthosine triphosphatase [Patescibacteria group bacterium]|nr:inosine/xanthosine triphosphatase [Patescibacteria group bacterium]
MKILVGSQNPVKIKASKEAFLKYFEKVEVVGIEVDSKVSDQPVGEETFRGAENRALELKRINETKKLSAKFYVGIEGGIMKLYSKWFCFGGMCIINNQGKTGFGTSPCFELSDKIVQELLSGIELGEVIDKIAEDDNTKQKGGAVGFFTKGIMKRKDFYVTGLTVALVPFMNDELYF